MSIGMHGVVGADDSAFPNFRKASIGMRVFAIILSYCMFWASLNSFSPLLAIEPGNIPPSKGLRKSLKILFMLIKVRMWRSPPAKKRGVTKLAYDKTTVFALIAHPLNLAIRIPTGIEVREQDKAGWPGGLVQLYPDGAPIRGVLRAKFPNIREQATLTRRRRLVRDRGGILGMIWLIFYFT